MAGKDTVVLRERRRPRELCFQSSCLMQLEWPQSCSRGLSLGLKEPKGKVLELRRGELSPEPLDMGWEALGP